MENTEVATKMTNPNFKDANYHQNAFVAVSQADQIQAGTFEHAIQRCLTIATKTLMEATVAARPMLPSWHCQVLVNRTTQPSLIS